jgi:hypothetical protein
MNSYSPNSINKSTITKSVIFLSFLAVMGVINNKNIYLNKPNFDCFFDYGTYSFTKIAHFFYQEAKYRNPMIIASSLFIDCIAFTVFFMWAVWGRSWAFLLTILKFYVFRMWVQNAYNMPYDQLYSFYYPGFPSVMVSYLKTNDFFYSGHVAMPLMSGFEFRRQGKVKTFYFCIFASIYQAVVMLSTRGHYGVDIVMGWIFAIYFNKISSFYVGTLDNFSLALDKPVEIIKGDSEYQDICSYSICEIKTQL